MMKAFTSMVSLGICRLAGRDAPPGPVARAPRTPRARHLTAVASRRGSDVMLLAWPRRPPLLTDRPPRQTRVATWRVGHYKKHKQQTYRHGQTKRLWQLQCVSVTMTSSKGIRRATLIYLYPFLLLPGCSQTAAPLIRSDPSPGNGILWTRVTASGEKLSRREAYQRAWRTPYPGFCSFATPTPGTCSNSPGSWPRDNRPGKLRGEETRGGTKAKHWWLGLQASDLCVDAMQLVTPSLVVPCTAFRATRE